MPKKAKKVRGEANLAATKKEVVMRGDKSPGVSRMFAVAMLVAIVFLISGAWFIWPGGESGGNEIVRSSLSSGSEEIAYPLGDFDDGRARHFSWQTPDGPSIRYFIMKSGDGMIRSAFDACDVCWRSGKGYSQSGDFMVCNNCGQRFSSIRINEVRGGCNPAPLERSVRNGQVFIQPADLLKGRSYFTLGPGDRT